MAHPPKKVAKAFGRVRADVTHAHVFFQTWWALNDAATPAEYRATMRCHPDFFNACSAGFLTLVFVAIGRLSDAGRKTLGLKKLREVLEDHGYSEEPARISDLLSRHSDLITRIRGIRNKVAAHTDREMTRDEVYRMYGVTADEIGGLLNEMVDSVNEIHQSLWSSGLHISGGERQRQATFTLLDSLKHGIE